jgi:hypothetical protein
MVILVNNNKQTLNQFIKQSNRLCISIFKSEIVFITDAMNEKFRKVDTHLHGTFVCITGLYKETRVQMLRICANYFVGKIK